MKRKFRAGILGATGAVGQKFVELLSDHPWFDISALMASDRSSGKTYREAAGWIGRSPIPIHVSEMVVRDSRPDVDCDVVFSGLDASVATEIEAAFAAGGYPVISNARNYRMEATVPLVIPEVNPDHMALIQQQTWPGGGFIVTNPNCSTVGVVCALKPLVDSFGVEAVHITTMQALSGAGYPGVPALDILGNVMPYIPGEEAKVATEPRKLLGTMTEGAVTPLDIPISVQCNRVPVIDGHMLSMSVRLGRKAERDEVIRSIVEFESPIADLNLPGAAGPFLRYFDDPQFPQPARNVSLGRGMTVSIGRLKPCPILDYRFVALVHNTIRGAAGGAVLNAELLISQGRIVGRPD